MRTLAPLFLLLGVYLTALPAQAAEEAPFEFRPGQTDQFAGTTCILRVSTPAVQKPHRMVWQLTYESRTLTQGNVALQPVENDVSHSTFEWKTPETANGVVLNATLRCHLEGSATEVVLPLRLRGPNPFEHVRETFEKNKIALFDPVGKTAEAFQGLEVTVQSVTTLQKVDEAPLVIIGEGVEWNDRLTERADELARQGKLVLMLRPQDDSTWPLKLSAENLSQWKSVSLAESGLVPKKLDIEFWGTDANTRSGWGLSISRQKLLMVPQIGPQVWEISEYHTVNKGRCLFIGFPLIARWSSSPVPRELLAEILISHLTPPSAAAAAEPH
jgi:hypothetical protein